MPARVWFVGEGSNELGYQRDGTIGRGVLEALIARLRATGWACHGKTQWNTIQKFRAGGAHIGKHGDYQNVLGLVLRAYEDASDAVVFARDVDADTEREAAVLSALEWIRAEDWKIEVIGGVARPALEGWMLALIGIRDTDGMSRRRANECLAENNIGVKSTDDYVALVDTAPLGAPVQFGLPPGTDSLRLWLVSANEALDRILDPSV